MATINIKNIKIRNFLSFGSTTTNFDLESGMNLVTGMNKDTGRINGTGKSSLLEAVVWGLYGKTIKDISKDQIINWKNKKKCCVETLFSIGEDFYKIERGIKPNILRIFKNDIELDQFPSVVDFQKHLETEILKIDHKTFVSLFYNNPNNFVSIFDIPKDQKRKLLENLFNLGAYSDLKNKINKKISSIESVFLENKTKTSKNLERIESLVNQIRKFDSDLGIIDVGTERLESLKRDLAEMSVDVPSKEEITDLQKRVDDCKSLISKVENDLNNTNKELRIIVYDQHAQEKLTTLKEDFVGKTYDLEAEEDLNNKKIEASLQLKLQKETLSKLKEKEKFNDLEVCPICNNTIDQKSLAEHRAEEERIIKDNINDLESKVKEIESLHYERKMGNTSYLSISAQIADYTIRVEQNLKYEELLKSKNKIQSSLDTFVKNKDGIERTLNEKKELVEKSNREVLINQIASEEEKIAERISQCDKIKEYKSNCYSESELLRGENVEYVKKNTSLEKLLEYYNFLKKLCADDKIKQYAISNLIPILNQKVNYYLSEAGIGFYIKLDGWLDCEIKGPGISNATAGSLSGGEKKSLDLALQFALCDVTKMKCKNIPSILILDEILDSSVDAKGISNMMKIISIKQKEENSSCFIISHRSEINSFTIDRKYTIVKSSGYSTLQQN